MELKQLLMYKDKDREYTGNYNYALEWQMSDGYVVFESVDF